MSSIIEISLKAKNNPTVNIIVNEAGSVTSTGSVSPVINFVATGEQGPTGAQGEQGTVSGTDVISQENISPGAVGTNELEDNSVTNAKLGTNSVYGTVIPNYAITNDKIGPNAITSDKIEDNAVTADHIAPNAITEELIEAGVITSDSIALNTINSGNIQNYTLVNTDYARNSVDGAVIVDNPEITGNISAVNYKAVGASPGTFEGPDDDEMHLKFHTDLKFVNSSGQIIGSIDQNGNLTISGTVDGIDISTDVAANTLKQTNVTTNISVDQTENTVTIQSSDGSDGILQIANSVDAGAYPPADKIKVDHLTVTQSVDLDAMETKLAGIEPGATADQTAEEIQDIVGDVVAVGGTKTGIAITYDDANNNMDFVVDHDTATNFVAEEHYRWDNDIQSTATINHVNLSSDTGSNGEVLSIVDGDAVWGHPEKVHLEVKNDEGATIPAGAPLYSRGEVGSSNRIKVGICDADDSAKMPCIGIAETEMNTSSTQNGFAIVSGVYNTNLSGFTSLAVGDNLYIQDDGSLSQTKPTGESSLVQNVGIVLRTNGTICQGLLVSAIGRTNDVPNLNNGNIFLGNASNLPQATTLSAAIQGAGNITIDGDLILDDDVIKGSSGNVILSSTSDIVKTPLGLFTNSISGYNNSDFELKAGGNVQFTLDVDDNETAQSFSFRDGGAYGSFTEIANLDQSGNLQIDGDLTVGGNNLKNNNGVTSLSFDVAGNVIIPSSIIGGTHYGDLYGDVTGDVTGDLTGNADTATSLTAGNKTIDGDLTIGANQAGHNFTVHGASTQNSRMNWDASLDFLKFSDQAKIVFGTGVVAADFDSSIQADGSNLVIYNDTGNIQIGDTVEITGDLDVTGNTTINGFTETNLKGSVYDSNNVAVVTTATGGNSTFAGTASFAQSLTAGNKTLDGNLTIDTGHSLTTPSLNTYQISPPSGTDNDLTIYSNGNIKFTLDNNTNETNQSFTFRNHDGYGNYTDMLTLDESGRFTLTGSDNDEPTIILNQNDNLDSAGSPRLEFFRNNLQPDNNELGEIVFKCRHQYGSENEFAKIIGIVEDTTFSERGGAVKIQVASHDGEIVDGLIVEDGDAEDEVDVTIASGSDSLTTVAGKLAIGGDLTGVTNFVDVKTAAYWGSSTSGFYLPLSGSTTGESTSLSTATYTAMYIAPFDGKIKRISSFHQNNASGTSTFEMYIDGDDSDLTNDQRGSDMTTASYNRKFTEDCPSDWTFSKGEAIAIRRTDSVARYGVTVSIVFEYDTTT